MFGMSHETFLLLDAVVTVIGLIVLITKFKFHPFIALTIAAAFLGLTSGMPTGRSASTGFIGTRIGLPPSICQVRPNGSSTARRLEVGRLAPLAATATRPASRVNRSTMTLDSLQS